MEKARRQALESPKLRVRTPSDINAARIGASAQKAAALEDEIRRLQRDVKHHREAEANLQAAMDAAAESWKCERAGTGASSEEEERLEDVRLTAAVAENARLEDELIREVRARRTVEEERFAAREEIRRIERDSTSKLESLVRERDELKERASALEEQLTNALKAAPADLSSVREREDALKAELNSARLEATNARSRVEETLRELSLVREAESKKAEKVGKKKLQASPRASTASPKASTASPRASTASPKASTSSPRASTVSPRASTASPRASLLRDGQAKRKLAADLDFDKAEAEGKLAKEVSRSSGHGFRTEALWVFNSGESGAHECRCGLVNTARDARNRRRWLTRRHPCCARVLAMRRNFWRSLSPHERMERKLKND